MQVKYITGIIIIIVIIIITVILAKPMVNPQPNNPPPESNTLTIVSTKPDPLDGATVVIDPALEIAFNKPVSGSKFKFRFEPEMEVNLVVVSSATIRITFKNPLELNQDYILVILPDTETADGLKLDKEYTFKFRTINYTGV